MSEHTYQSETAAEQQPEDALEAPESTSTEEATSEKGRSRVGPVVLEVLQHAKKALTPQQVHEKLPEFSEQQINAAILNLYKKGAGKLERIRQGRSFAYSAKPEKMRQRRSGRAVAQTKIPQESLVAAKGPVQETKAPAIEKFQGQNQAKVQERQPLNITVSMDGLFAITKGDQTISLDAKEREQFFSFVSKFL